MSLQHMSIAFGLGVQVAEGAKSEGAARDWIGSVISFAAAHPNAADTCDPLELGDALEAAFQAGKDLGVAAPKPTAPALETEAGS